MKHDDCIDMKHGNDNHGDDIQICGNKRCLTCCDNVFKPVFESTITRKAYKVINPFLNPLTCSSTNVIYLVTCSRCGIQYVGETSNGLNKRMNGHRYTIRNKKMTLLAEHFSGNDEGCNITHFKVQPIERVSDDQKNVKTSRLKRESFWIKELRTLTPYGLNDRLDSYNWRFRTRNDIAGKVFNHLEIKRGARGRGTRKRLRKRLNEVFDSDKFLSELNSSYRNLRNWRYLARKTINSLSLKTIRDLSWIFASYYYDVESTFPREITNLVLDLINYRIFLAKKETSKTNNRNFVKVLFQSPQVEKVDLPSIFRKHLDSIPHSFKSRDSPTLIYSRSKKIGSTIFNYKDVVENVITKDWQHNAATTCNCSSSDFCDPHHHHIVTGDLRIIRNRKLRSLMSKGPGYREKANIHWLKFLKDVKKGLNDCIMSWAQSEKVDVKVLNEWSSKVFEDVKSKVQKLKRVEAKYCRYRSILHSKPVEAYLKDLHKDFVLVPTDKASNNIAVVCKKFYIEQSLKELDIYHDAVSGQNDINTYMKVDKNPQDIINRHKRYMKSQLKIDTLTEKLPFLYWIPKMHKKPYSKQRYIAASYACTTKDISAILTKCLKLVEKQHRIICRQYEKNYGINPMWIIQTSRSVHQSSATFNLKKDARDIRTYDFSTLYTSIPHFQLRKQLRWVIKEAFKSSKYSFISVYKSNASWTNSPGKHTQHLSCDKVIRLMNWLLDNIYVTFGDNVFRQVIGIPMGTDCAPFLANLFLYSYEFKWIDKQKKLNNWHVLKHFRSSSRYIDDLLMINNADQMVKYMTDIYPKELALVPDDTDGKSCPFLDLQITITDSVISTSIYDKRDTFDFPIVNFPTLTGNIPRKSSYGVFTGEVVRYARACTYFEDFKLRTLSLVSKLKKQAFLPRLLKRTWLRFCDSHILLVQKYGPQVIFLYEDWM